MADVLVVDESDSLRELMTSALSHDHTVHEAASSAQALDIAGKQECGVVIIDVHVSGDGGIELVRQLRGLPSCQHTPIVIVTTEQREDRIAAGKAAGANAWMMKPFDPDRLVDVVQHLTGTG